MRALGACTAAAVVLWCVDFVCARQDQVSVTLSLVQQELKPSAFDAFSALRNKTFAGLGSGNDGSKFSFVLGGPTGVSVNLTGVNAVGPVVVSPSSSSSSAVGSRSLSPGGFVCNSFPSSYDPTRFCSGIVDYPYILPDMVTDAILETTARTYAAALGISLLKSTCLTDIKRYICANVYSKCISNIVPGDATTYATVATLAGGSTSLPYYRPCQSICTAVSYAGTTCAGILEALGAPLKCSSNDATNTFTLYAPDAESTCNKLASTLGVSLVADKTEKYVGTQCSGISKQILVPSSSTLDPTGKLAPMLPPFVAQLLTEKGLSGIFGAVPRSLKSDCLTNLRKVLCSLKMMKPQPLSTLQAYFGTVYMPQFPEQQLCVDYVSTCGYLISVVPALGFNCAATTMGGTVQLFPTTTQTITTVMGAPLKTDPNTLSDVDPTFSIATQCPIGYAVPANPAEPYTNMPLPALACAIQCPLRVYTDWDYVYRIAVVGTIFQLLVSIFQSVNSYIVPAKKACIYTQVMTTAALWEVCCRIVHLFSSVHFPGANGPITSQCSSETSWVHPADALMNNIYGSNSNAAGICLLHATNQRIYYYTATWAATNIFIEIWMRVVLGVKDVSRLKIFYNSTTAAVYFAVYFYWWAGAKTHYWNTPLSTGVLCSASSDPSTEDVALWGLTIVNFVFNVILGGWGMIKCIRITLSSQQSGEKNPLRKLWKAYRILFSFGIAATLYYPMYLLVVYMFATNMRKGKITASTTDWLGCTLKSFISVDADPTLSAAKCGAYPSDSFSYSELIWLQVFSVFTPFCVAICTNTSETDKFWWSLVPVSIQNSIVCLWCRDRTLKILPSDKTSIGDTSMSGTQSMHDRSSVGSTANKQDEEDSDDDESEVARMKATTKRVPVSGPVNSDQAKAMGEEAAKLAAQLYLDLGKVDDSKLTPGASTPCTAVSSPGNSECNSPDASERLTARKDQKPTEHETP